MKKITFLLLALLMLASCVEEFKVPNTITQKYESEIVIQGRILAGEESVVYVSYTTAFGEENISPTVRNAQVTIIGENGYKSETAEYEPLNACYIIDTKEIATDVRYAIEVKLDGETYQSEYLEIIDSPDINEITYQEHEEGISIHVTTLAKKEDSRHYMWSYEEDWEFHAEVNILMTPNNIAIYDKIKYPLIVEPQINPYYYCWMQATSRNVNLYSTEELNENSAKEVKLIEIPAEDIRISYIYSILVKQWSVSEAAYNYFKTLKLYTEDSGGLFTPMPTEILGNISCISSPNKKARGYVLASNVKTKRLFIYSADFKKTRPLYENCMVTTTHMSRYWKEEWPQRIEDFGYVALTNSGKIDVNTLLYSPECVNCQRVKGSTKKRPDFWPNNHE